MRSRRARIGSRSSRTERWCRTDSEPGIRRRRLYLNLRPRLYNPAWALLAGSGPPGTLRFGGEWALLDQLIVSGGALAAGPPRYVQGSLRVFATREVPATTGPAHVLLSGSGEPLAFDPATGRGASDHLPLVASVEL